MVLKLRPRYEKEPKEITDFIALGSPSKAKEFAKKKYFYQTKNFANISTHRQNAR